MANEPTRGEHESLVKTYFDNIRDLRNGKENAVGKLIELWDEDGVFEFAGSPPVTATFRGRNAIHVLYKNRLAANGMPLRLESAGKSKGDREAASGVVDTEVSRTKRLGNKIVAAWTTVVGTRDREGFQVHGSHTFDFKNGKIANLRIVVSPRPEASRNLKLEGLAVDDIGPRACSLVCRLRRTNRVGIPFCP